MKVDGLVGAAGSASQIDLTGSRDSPLLRPSNLSSCPNWHYENALPDSSDSVSWIQQRRISPAVPLRARCAVPMGSACVGKTSSARPNVTILKVGETSLQGYRSEYVGVDEGVGP